MTRGYLSLRFNEANPSHHLYVNTGGRADGNYWVAYTPHFGGRKRRIRRSLGTKCLADAIRLRLHGVRAADVHADRSTKICG